VKSTERGEHSPSFDVSNLMETKKANEWVPPTGIALEVQQWLHSRAKSVIGKFYYVTTRSVRAVAERCSVVAISLEFQHIDPKEMVAILRLLIDKGMVNEFTFDGLPSFIPISYCSVAVTTTRPLTQYDIDNG
jgi:hypothetical protein